MTASFRPRVPATTDEHAFRDTGMMFAADATRRSYRRVAVGTRISPRPPGRRRQLPASVPSMVILAPCSRPSRCYEAAAGRTIHRCTDHKPMEPSR
jgi:hypothetical protein